MTVTAEDFSTHIVEPTLRAMRMRDERARRLLVLTGRQESDLNALVQIGGGPAVSPFQIEWATFDDIFDRYTPEVTDAWRALVERQLGPCITEHRRDLWCTLRRGPAVPKRQCGMNLTEYLVGFQRLLTSLNAKRGCGWSVNPWAWRNALTAEQRSIDAEAA